ncbi:MAG: 23S rRNA pseudouridine(955/2504/2580) synthase RluC [Gammaproteobacteria bacterium]|nr:23S rRNA pseudouridine(955/2504/2580) synthase RluC [Gammaproteobacteria bacterium]
MTKQVQHAVRYLTVTTEYAGQRVDNFLITLLGNIPKTRIYRMVRKGEVRINKKRVEASYRLQAGDLLRIPPVYQAEKAPIERPSDSLQALLAKRILFEDDALFIINKPAGVPVHGGTGLKMGVIDALRFMYPKLLHLELAHRLDKETSGCLLLAKKRSALKVIHTLLREGQVEKKYLALTLGHWEKNELRVDVPLLKNQLASGARIVRVDPEGKSALTVFKPLQTFQNATLVEATLHTGRTHQIRVHATYRHHPLACDEKYGDRDFDREVKKTGLKRLFLHAHHVSFIHPVTEKRISVTAELDEDLKACLGRLS